MVLSAITLVSFLTACTSNIKGTDSATIFINKMVETHEFDKVALDHLFESVHINQDILKRMSTPAEGLPWYKYRKIFITEARIQGGLKFWQENAETLSLVEKKTGIPPEIIVAIIGVETSYGQKTGNYGVLEALSTLAFAYPARSAFFQSELENFLLLCREEHLDPLDLKGSYAGAMGSPQFMPSSFRTYAVDFNKDGRRDIWRNNSDIIASVANYFIKHGWQAGQEIALPVSASGERYKVFLNQDLKPHLRFDQLESLNLNIKRPLPLNTEVTLLAFEQSISGQHTSEELWVGLNNFYVITRYNHSPLYAMAVYQLGQSILNEKGKFP